MVSRSGRSRRSLEALEDVSITGSRRAVAHSANAEITSDDLVEVSDVAFRIDLPARGGEASSGD